MTDVHCEKHLEMHSEITEKKLLFIHSLGFRVSFSIQRRLSFLIAVN